MSECEICGKEDAKTTECDKCGVEFCNDCGDSSKGECTYCSEGEDEKTKEVDDF